MTDEPTHENLVIAVPDALRSDFTPDWPGTQVRTITAAPHTPGALPAIVSGRKFEEHGNSWFWGSNVQVPTVFDLEQEGYDVGYWDHPADRSFNILRNPPFKPLEDMEPPFIWVARFLWTHTPYGVAWEDLEEWEDIGPRPEPRTAREYPEEYTSGLWSDGNDYIDKMRTGDVPWLSDYKASVEKTTTRLEDVEATLADMGVADDTMFVVAPDHGEAFGALGYDDDCPHLIHNDHECKYQNFVTTTFWDEDLAIEEPMRQVDILAQWDERWAGGRHDLEQIEREPPDIQQGDRGTEDAKKRLRELGYIE